MNNELRYVKSYQELKKSRLIRDTIQEGDYICIEDENAMYQYKNGAYEKVSISQEGSTNISLYDLNKQIISQMKNDISDEEATKILEDFAAERRDTKHYGMMNRETNYFTIFIKNVWKAEPNLKFAAAVLDIAHSLGELKTIDRKEDHLEIWISTDKDTYVYLLFDYEIGVIYYG